VSERATRQGDRNMRVGMMGTVRRYGAKDAPVACRDVTEQGKRKVEEKYEMPKMKKRRPVERRGGVWTAPGEGGPERSKYRLRLIFGHATG